MAHLHICDLPRVAIASGQPFMPRVCDCQGSNQNCRYCYGSGYVDTPPTGDHYGGKTFDAHSLAQTLANERRSAGTLLDHERTKRAEAESRADSLAQTLDQERAKRIEAESHATELAGTLADERARRTEAEGRANSLAKSLDHEQEKSHILIVIVFIVFVVAMILSLVMRAAD